MANVNVLSRADVGLRPPKPGTSIPQVPRARGTKLHYPAGHVPASIVDDHAVCLRLYRSYQSAHFNNGWSDVGYNGGACGHRDRQGRYYLATLRGFSRLPAANGPGLNTQHQALLALVGDRGHTQPTPDLIAAIREGMAYIRERGHGTEILGHRDGYATSCPGDPLYRELRAGNLHPGSTGGGTPAAPVYETYRLGVSAGSRTIRRGSAGDDVKVAQDAIGAEVDGYFGGETQQKTRSYQTRHGLQVDGIIGPQTWGRILGRTQPAPAPTAPAWPGVVLLHPPLTRHSSARTWQAQMRRRGWLVTVDGAYGSESRRVCEQFQTECNREGHSVGAVDGKVGPRTWAASWTKPVT